MWYVVFSLLLVLPIILWLVLVVDEWRYQKNTHNTHTRRNRISLHFHVHGHAVHGRYVATFEFSCRMRIVGTSSVYVFTWYARWRTSVLYEYVLSKTIDCVPYEYVWMTPAASVVLLLLWRADETRQHAWVLVRVGDHFQYGLFERQKESRSTIVVSSDDTFLLRTFWLGPRVGRRFVW